MDRDANACDNRGDEYSKTTTKIFRKGANQSRRNNETHLEKTRDELLEGGLDSSQYLFLDLIMEWQKTYSDDKLPVSRRYAEDSQKTLHCLKTI